MKIEDLPYEEEGEKEMGERGGGEKKGRALQGTDNPSVTRASDSLIQPCAPHRLNKREAGTRLSLSGLSHRSSEGEGEGEGQALRLTNPLETRGETAHKVSGVGGGRGGYPQGWVGWDGDGGWGVEGSRGPSLD